MEISNIKVLSIDEVKFLYREYLQTQNLSKSTITTSCVDAFYIWRKCGGEVFWQVITAADFESAAKDTLLEALKANSAGNLESNINGYLAHLRRFRRFLDLEHNKDIQIKPKYITPSKRISKRMKVDVATPTSNQVDHYLKKWDSLENYQLQESALNKLFFELCPNNKEISDVLLKAATLNDFYSTNIFSIYPVAKHIVSKDIDIRLRQGDSSLVSEIQHIVVNNKLKNFYSFATKYCSHHNPLNFPIYDSYVDEVLRYFRTRDGFSRFDNNKLKDYNSFKQILLDFQRFYNLDEYNLKQIDKYIWQLGKEYFPKKY